MRDSKLYFVRTDLSPASRDNNRRHSPHFRAEGSAHNVSRNEPERSTFPNRERRIDIDERDPAATASPSQSLCATRYASTNRDYLSGSGVLGWKRADINLGRLSDGFGASGDYTYSSNGPIVPPTAARFTFISDVGVTRLAPAFQNEPPWLSVDILIAGRLFPSESESHRLPGFGDVVHTSVSAIPAGG